jgi:flagellar hook-basal body complex protein FliE
MSTSILGGISQVGTSLLQTDNANKTSDSSSTSFANVLKGALDNTNNMIAESENLANQFAAGKIDNMDQVLISSEKADIALQFTWAVRNKIFDAYSEIMRMQI